MFFLHLKDEVDLAPGSPLSVSTDLLDQAIDSAEKAVQYMTSYTRGFDSDIHFAAGPSEWGATGAMAIRLATRLEREGRDQGRVARLRVVERKFIRACEMVVSPFACCLVLGCLAGVSDMKYFCHFVCGILITGRKASDR